MTGDRSRVSTIGAGVCLAVLAAAAIVANTDFREPPRYDGAGYCVLARSILEGKGYREIDHPDQPPHAHFPPLYPLTLALLWSLTGPSYPAAHVFSTACTAGAVVFAWLWMRRYADPRDAFALGAALAVNWSWSRIGGAIQSEPLFLLLSYAGVWLAAPEESNSVRNGFAVGLIGGLAVLTRHVGVCLVGAFVLDALMKRRYARAAAVAATSALVVAPWVYRLATVDRPTQAGLFEWERLIPLVGEQTLFYLRRLPDLIAGPIVESATVFGRSRAISIGATVAAAMASGIVVAGWVRLARGSDSRLAGLILGLTMALLLVWPFTEAGRFLVPLLPAVLLGAKAGWEGIPFRPARRVSAALLLLGASLPYSTYAVVTGRAAAQRGTHADYDAARAWIDREGKAEGIVLTRHPGESFLATGRPALAVETGGAAKVEEILARRRVAYLLVDDGRYAGAPASPAGEFARTRPERVRLVRDGITRVYEIVAPPSASAP